jgi:hypothetical protein
VSLRPDRAKIGARPFFKTKRIFFNEWVIIQVVECLSSMHKILGSIPDTKGKKKMYMFANVFVDLITQYLRKPFTLLKK